MKQTLIEFYLDYFNNYLTVSKIAQDYGLSESVALLLIDAGRIQYEEYCRENKYHRSVYA